MSELELNRFKFIGYYGMSNFGDDLFGVIAYEAALKYWKSESLSIVAPKVRGSSSVYSVPRAVSERIYQLDNWLGRAVRLRYVLGESFKADKVIFSGGSLFSSKRSGVLSLLQKAHKKKSDFFSAVGVSIGPFDSMADEKRTIEFIRTFEYISVRDLHSFDFLKSLDLDLNVVDSGDMCGLMSPKVRTVPGVYMAKEIGFSPCFQVNDIGDSHRLCEEFVEAIKYLSKSVDLSVKVLSLNEHPVVGDSELCLKTYNELNKNGIKCSYIKYKDIGIFATLDLILSFDAYITSRLHGAIVAYMSKVPFFLYEYHVKCSEFLNDIDQDASLRLPYANSDAAEILEVLLLLLSSGKNVFPKRTVSSYQCVSRRNFTKAPWSVVAADKLI